MAKTAAVPADKLELYEKLVATNPTVERKGATVPYTSLNGHMSSFLTREGTLALRLPTREREEFLKKYRTRLCEQHGTVMEEYVEVPDSLLRKTRELKRHFDLSCAYVGILEPKPTTNKKKAAVRRPAAKKKTVTKKTAKKKTARSVKKTTKKSKAPAKRKTAKKKRR